MKKNYLILVFVISAFFSVNKASAQIEPIVGQIAMFAGNFEPRGWYFCDGRTLSVQQNYVLFSIIGTMYGGDGVSTFKLPDLRQRVPVGQGLALGSKVMGEMAGSETTQILSYNMPIHTHQLMGSTATGNSNIPSNNLLADTSVLDKEYTSTGTGLTNMSPQAIGPAGGNVPISIMQPYLVINYIIAVEGVYPSRW